MNYDSLLLKQFNMYYEWLTENNCIPEILANTKFPEVKLPANLLKQPQVVLNISISAVTQFQVKEESLSFITRFNGKSFSVYIPLRAIIGFLSRSMTPKVVMPMLNIEAMVKDAPPPPISESLKEKAIAALEQPASVAITDPTPIKEDTDPTSNVVSFSRRKKK